LRTDAGLCRGVKRLQTLGYGAGNPVTPRRHYDALIDENNDPVHDPMPLKT